MNCGKRFHSAVDRQAIVNRVIRAGQVPAYSLVPDGAWNYKPAYYSWREASIDDRVARARKLYAEAGYSAAKPLRLRLLYDENELVQKVCIAIAAMWKEKLGVDTELIQMEFKAYLAARADPAEWDVVRVGWTADYNDASTFLDTMSRDSPQNFGRWVHSEYARLLESAANEADPAKRINTLQQAESLMLNDYPLLPVYFYVSRRLVQPGISAPAINPMNRTYSKYFRPGSSGSERTLDLGCLDQLLEVRLELLLVHERTKLRLDRVIGRRRSRALLLELDDVPTEFRLDRRCRVLADLELLQERRRTASPSDSD